ncbi:hypothetical protein NUU61_005822 [Penicillium alfredii]|uniref:Uncharacterized protein n=1 Tax=Penicillium alfredii TaxID=1506179 RepID=A0A9W9K8J5_9EURO|nr:uncharacterized protein NUU61_005822 [Penicillium alfredii]KAJ5096466.1 hypothetical protein NUU61_005822 [Penicillium alfredii]
MTIEVAFVAKEDEGVYVSYSPTQAVATKVPAGQHSKENEFASSVIIRRKDDSTQMDGFIENGAKAGFKGLRA